MIPQRTCPASRGLLFQSEVRSVFVIVGDVIREKSLQMSLVQRDCVVEQLTATTAYPALSPSILPRASNRRAHWRDLHRFPGHVRRYLYDLQKRVELLHLSARMPDSTALWVVRVTHVWEVVEYV